MASLKSLIYDLLKRFLIGLTVPNFQILRFADLYPTYFERIRMYFNRTEWIDFSAILFYPNFGMAPFDAHNKMWTLNCEMFK